MVPRSQGVIRNLASLPVRPGPNRPIEDVQQTIREVQQQVRRPTWDIYSGIVQAGISGLGWHRVAIEGGNGVVSLLAGGRTDGWGVQTDQPIQAGSQVFVAVDWVTGQAITLGHMSTRLTNPNDKFSFSSFVGSWADTTRDVVAEVYSSAVDAGGALAIDNGAMSDVHQGDYSIRTSTGMQLLVSPLEMSLVADDVTGLWVNLIDQSIELSGRQVSVAADGLRLENRLADHTGRLQLGGGLNFYHDPEVQTAGTYDEWRKTDCDFAYRFDVEPVEIFCYSLYAVPDGIIEQHTGDYLRAGGGQAVDFRGVTISRLPQLSFVEYRPDRLDQASEWSPEPGAEQQARDTLSERLTAWHDSVDDLHFSQPLAAFTSLAAGWVKDSEQYVRLVTAQENIQLISGTESESSDLLTAIVEHESVQFGSEEPFDVTFSGNRQTAWRHLASWIHPQADGSLFIGHEGGAGVRITGTGVFIEGTSIRLAATKDITLLGRDVNLRANRDVNITSRTFLRLYSQRNVSVLGGLSGTGGVLVESRSSGSSFELPDDAQKSKYSGVVLRSTSSPIVLQGGDVLLHAAAKGSGQLMLRSDGGPVSTVTPYRVVTHSAGRLDTFGSNPDRPTSSNYFGQTAVVLNASLKAKSGYFSESLLAASNIQSFYGQVASAQGGQLGKASSQGIATFQQGLELFEKLSSDEMTAWGETRSQIKEQLGGTGGPLSQRVRDELSGGFVNGGLSARHFGAASLQPTVMSVFQSSWSLPTRPMDNFVVDYKPGSETASGPTYGWPGDVSSVRLSVPTVDRLEQRIVDSLSRDPKPITNRDLSFAQVFATLQGETDE